MGTKTEWAWAAGLIEGEGCFFINSTCGKGTHAGIHVCMTDLDVLKKLKTITKAGNIHSIKGKSVPHWYKPKWQWSACRQQDILHIIDNCLPWLGKRRLKKAKTVRRWVSGRLKARGLL